MTDLPRQDRLTSQLCREINNLEWELSQAREEIAQLREELANFTTQSIASSNRFVGNMLALVLTHQKLLGGNPGL